MTAHPNTWPDRTDRNWSLGGGKPRWFHWRGTGTSPEDAFASARRDARRIMTVLTDGRGTMPGLDPTPNGSPRDWSGDPPWAASFGAGDCDIEIRPPMLEAAREAGLAQERSCTADDAVAAARALMRLCAARLLAGGGDNVSVWLGNGSSTAGTISIQLAPFAKVGATHFGNAPLPEPHRAALAAASAAYATLSHPEVIQVFEVVPESATARAIWRRNLDEEGSVRTLAGFLGRAGLPDDARTLLKTEAGGWRTGRVR